MKYAFSLDIMLSRREGEWECDGYMGGFDGKNEYKYNI